jgi:hypothetical protein
MPHAGGEGILRFTAAFPRGLRSFSSSNLTIHPSDPLPWFYQAAGWNRRGHHLSMQPVYQLALPCGGGFLGSRVLRSLSGGWGLPRKDVAISLGRFADLHQSVSPVILGSSGLPGKAGFLPGVTLRPLLRLWQAFTGDITLFFSCTRRMDDFRLGQGRSSLHPDRRLSSFEVSCKALSH